MTFRTILLLIQITMLFYFVPVCGATDTNYASDAGQLLYLTEDYYPFNYTQNNNNTGISVEILKLMWKEMGIPEQKILVAPWARGYREVQKNPIAVLFGMAWTPERDNMFKWVGPYYSARFILVGHKRRSIRISSMDDLKRYSIGTVRDDIADALLSPLKKFTRIEPTNSMLTNMRKLMLNRVDLVALEENSLNHFLTKHGYSPDDFEVVYLLKQIDVYYALNKSVPDKVKNEMQNALNKVMRSANYTDIIDQFLKD